ncbi:toxin CcdB [Gammaproteobacteria bacterium]
MAQFGVHRNPNPDTHVRFPLLLDVQSDLVADLGTRVVVPLCPAAAMTGKVIKTLIPVFEIDGQQYAMMTPQLAGISRKQVGAKVADLAQRRDEILAALDFLITGI